MVQVEPPQPEAQVQVNADEHQPPLKQPEGQRARIKQRVFLQQYMLNRNSSSAILFISMLYVLFFFILVEIMLEFIL